MLLRASCMLLDTSRFEIDFSMFFTDKNVTKLKNRRFDMNKMFVEQI